MRTIEEIQREIEIHGGNRDRGNPHPAQLTVHELLFLILKELKSQNETQKVKGGDENEEDG